MTGELEKRWRNGAPPFDGPVLVARDELTEHALLVIIRLSLGLLREAHGTSGLRVNNDWHDHDGFINDARVVSWMEAASWAQDVEGLRKSCSDDWLVHTLLFPDDFTFCLRYWLDDEREGYLDLCAGHGMLERLAPSLRAEGVEFRIEPSAKDYFDRRWDAG